MKNVKQIQVILRKCDFRALLGNLMNSPNFTKISLPYTLAYFDLLS